MKNKEKKSVSASRERAQEFIENDSSIDTDPLGMYTGVPRDPYEKPVQDADDL